jgi:hypothetical protein
MGNNDTLTNEEIAALAAAGWRIVGGGLSREDGTVTVRGEKRDCNGVSVISRTRAEWREELKRVSLQADLTRAPALVEETRTAYDALVTRVHTFADQLLAWGHEDAAAQVRREILQGPVVTDQSYHSLLAYHAATNRMRAALVEAQEELAKGQIMHAQAAIRRGLGE